MRIKKNSDERFKYKIKAWTTFYRLNIHRFVSHYLGIELHLFQQIWLFLMNVSFSTTVIASRGIGKSWLIAVFCCAKCILYPNSKVVVASATKGQARLIISEKIEKDLMEKSPNLRREIRKVVASANQTEVIFKNGSSIVVVPASDNARGYRSTLMIYEEFRMIEKNIVDSVLSPFGMVRPTPFVFKDEYKHLKEEPVEIFISSAWYASHWMYGQIKNALASMYSNGESYLLAFDLFVSLEHGLKTERQIMRDKKKMDENTFMIEYENIMLKENSKAYFSFDMINKNQKIKKAFYPVNNVEYASKKDNPKFKNKNDVLKQDGEIRIIGADVSMVGGNKNDNTVFTCMRLIPTNGQYERQVCYIESINGGHTEQQAIRLKQLFNDFNADYVALDTAGVGIGIYDAVAKLMFDEERNEEYPAWTCFNDEDTAKRVSVPNAKSVVFGIKANAKLNHDIAQKMRTTLEKEKIKLLVNLDEGKDHLTDHVKEYTSTKDYEVMARYDSPYSETEFLRNEMIGLEYEVGEATRLIKLKEKNGSRKDRYSSLSYANYLADQLENDLLSNGEYEDDDDIVMF